MPTSDDGFGSVRTTRREFLARAGIGMAGAATLAGLGSRVAFGDVLRAQAPKPGGTAQVALSLFDPSSHLDPALAGSDFDLMATGMLFDNLVNLGSHLQVLPALAKEWTVSKDARVWTFKIRPGVVFHDGSPLTADDVVFTLKRILDPKVGSYSQSALGANLKASGIKKLDSHTVRLTLTKPNSFMGQLLTGYNFRIVKNGASKAQLSKHPVGTGPFVFKTYAPGDTFSVMKNPHYWQHGLPYLDGVLVKSVPEQVTKVQDVTSGAYDLADDIDIPTVIQLQSNSAVKLYSLPNASFNVIAVHQHTKPFGDLRVRQAIKMSFDRNKLAQIVLQGHGLVGKDIPVAADDSLYPADFQPLPYDPQKAKSLLARAGFPNGLPITLYTSDAAAYMLQSATVFQNLAKAGNVNVTLKQTSSSTYWSSYFNKKPAFCSFWLREPADLIIHQACIPNPSGLDESQFSSATFTKLVNAARTTTDLKKQRQYYAEAMPILAHQSGWVIPTWGNRYWPAKTRLQGLALNFVSKADFSRAYLT